MMCSWCAGDYENPLAEEDVMSKVAQVALLEMNACGLRRWLKGFRNSKVKRSARRDDAKKAR